jgi:hypothetical protein
MTTMKMGALDMMRADSRIISAMGPIDTGPADEIAAAVHALAVAGGPATRFGLVPTPASRLWRFAPDALLHEVIELPPCTAEDLPAVLSQRARSTLSSHPLSIAVAGQYLIVDLCHGLGDARLVNMLNQVLGERIAPQRLPDWSQGHPIANPLGSAIARFYGAQPQQIRALLANRRGAADAPVTPADVVPWRRAPVVVASRSEHGAAGRLRRPERLSSRISLASILFAALSSEIRSHGIDLDDSVTVIFDCRRYLPKTSRVYGNFVSGVDLTVADPGDPAQLHTAITGAAACGRPLAALLVSAHKFHRRYRSRHAYTAATSVSRRPRAKLVFSDIGDVFADSPMWSGDPAHRFYNAVNEPADPQAIVFTITHRGTEIDVTASFHANVFSPTIIQSALDAVVREPERHLAQREA